MSIHVWIPSSRGQRSHEYSVCIYGENNVSKQVAQQARGRGLSVILISQDIQLSVVHSLWPDSPPQAKADVDMAADDILCVYQDLSSKAVGLQKFDILLHGTIILVDRQSSSDKIKIWVQTSQGIEHVVVKAVAVCFPPTIKTMAGFDLDECEIKILDSVQEMQVWSGMIRWEGGRVSVEPKGVSEQYGIVHPVGIKEAAAKNAWTWRYRCTTETTELEVEGRVLDELHRLSLCSAKNSVASTQQGIVKIQKSMNSEISVSGKDSDFNAVEVLSELQGRHKTWYINTMDNDEMMAQFLSTAGRVVEAEKYR